MTLQDRILHTQKYLITFLGTRKLSLYITGLFPEIIYNVKIHYSRETDYSLSVEAEMKSESTSLNNANATCESSAKFLSEH